MTECCLLLVHALQAGTSGPNRGDQVQALVEKATMEDPSHQVAWVWRAEILHDQQKFEQAMAACDKALATTPSISSWGYEDRHCRQYVDALRKVLLLGDMSGKSAI
eukprot:COSAG03_NODE_3052_length_2264_cov_1.782910_1_plen_106_part_00